jgi:hypothetical protein
VGGALEQLQAISNAVEAPKGQGWCKRLAVSMSESMVNNPMAPEQPKSKRCGTAKVSPVIIQRFHRF